MIVQGFSYLNGKNVLLLQGPVGPFFRRLAHDLKRAGARVHKVNFNGGDWFFSPCGASNFRGHKDAWPAYFEGLLGSRKIDTVMLFGDCRELHQIAHSIALQQGVDICVFEEGYIRPDYITFERHGVNNHSLIPRDAAFYLAHPAAHEIRPLYVGNTYWYAVRCAALYYFAAGILQPWFKHYEHHRPLNWAEFGPWLRSMGRKQYYRYSERALTQQFCGESVPSFFLVPLQVYNDAQVHVHSDFDSVTQFIIEVTASFAAAAPPDTLLVIKHHPMDRGYHDYSQLIAARIAQLGLQNRCFYIHDQHLPTLLQRARGVVVINSTVGLSALHHGTPLKVCGNAIYDMPGLTFQGDLDDFWQAAERAQPDTLLLNNFLHYLVAHTQLNGSFYKKLAKVGTATGLRWMV